MQNVNERTAQKRIPSEPGTSEKWTSEKRALWVSQKITDNISFIYSMVFISIAPQFQNTLEIEDQNSLNKMNAFVYNGIAQSKEYSKLVTELRENFLGIIAMIENEGSTDLTFDFASAIKKIYKEKDDKELIELLGKETFLTKVLMSNLSKLDASDIRSVYQALERSKLESPELKMALLLSKSMRPVLTNNNSSNPMEKFLANHPEVDSIMEEDSTSSESSSSEISELPKLQISQSSDNESVQEPQPTGIVFGQS
jgi:hypothetical protein